MTNDAARDEILQRIPFWYLRHGETDWNAQGLSQGNVDIPLNPTGLAQARSAAERLRHRGITTIVSSPLSRARVTADIVGQALGLPVQLDEGLREVRFGVQEGHPMSDWFAHWVAGHLTPEGAETFAELRRRAVAALNRAIGLPPAVLVVAHGALFRALRTAMGIEPLIRTPNAVPILCEPTAGDPMRWELNYHA
ncbi:MAG TPA: histidine phosphatase family protein [Acetobacteraceae bacterium]|nr:histidine phosphatase family protein [Acetobacteraceae bacterium]